VADRFSLLKYGLAVVLVFVGAKMILIDLVKIPVGLSLRQDARRRAAAVHASAKA